MTDFIGSVIDLSGTVIDPSGSVIDPSGTMMAHLMDAMMATYEPPPPQIITLSDILNEKSVLTAKELSDKALIDSIESLSLDILKPKLIQWALNGFPNAFPIYEFSLTLPDCCSDGNHRCLAEYITFCSGKPIQDHVALLQARMPDIAVSFCNTGRSIQIVVSKPTV